MFWMMTSRRARGLLLVSLLGLLLGGALALAALPARAQAPPPPASATPPGSAEGDWHGALAIGPRSLRLEISLKRGADGTLGGQLVSLDQLSPPLPMAEARLADGTLSFTVPAVQGRYSGTWDAAKGGWSGVWLQGMPLPLVLTPGKYPPTGRPQEPKPPFPYEARPVAFDGGAPGVKLAGTLTMPAGAGPFPAVVLISGSGPQDRDETLMGHRPFLLLADTLTRHGVAVQRYDDRGTAQSTGAFGTALGRDFADDAAAAHAWLRTQPGIDPARVGLMGHSEGGLIAPQVAGRDPAVAFVVLLAGPGVPGREIMPVQRRAVLKAMGLPPAAIESAAAQGDALDAAVLAAPSPEAARAEARRLLTAAGVPAEAVEGQVRTVASPWYRDFLAHDPRPALQALKVPVLAVNGSVDAQVVASQNLPALREAMAGNPAAEVVELAGLNHLFQTSATGDPGEYGNLPETMSPTALKLISDWIARR